MPYFVRFEDAKFVEESLARGFSCWMGDFDLQDALDHSGLGDKLGIETYSLDAYSEDEIASFEESLEDVGMARYSDGRWRGFHHKGLSCHIIPAQSLEKSIDWVKSNTRDLGYGCDHESMFNATWVASLDDCCHVFYAEGWDRVGTGSGWNELEGMEQQ